MPELSERPVEELPEMLKVFGDAVGQTPFEVCPDEFVGVELGRIPREVKGLDPRMTFEELLDESGTVKRAPVPKEDDRPFEVTGKVAEELLDLFGPDVPVGMEARVEPKPSSLGRDGDGGDGRDFCPASGHHQDGSLSFDRPGPLEVWDERESAFIQEDQVRFKPFGFFLYAAKRAVSNNGWLVPGALWPASAAFGSSSPGAPLNSKDCRCNTSPGSVSKRSGRSVSKSKDPSNTRPPRDLSPEPEPGCFSGCRSEAEAGPYSGEPSSPTALFCGNLDASGPPNLTRRPFSEPLNGKSCLVLKAGRLDAVFFRVSGDCHEVS